MSKKVSKPKIITKSPTPKNIKEASKVSRAVFDTAKERLLKLTTAAQSFKIGETGGTLKDRLAQPDYRDTYTNIKSLYSSKNKQLINQLEALIIKHCMRFYEKKCDNKSPHSHNDMTDVNGKYHVYFVYS